LNEGVDAFNRWSFINRWNLDGQWQLVDTWDPNRITLRDEFTPHPNAYYGIGLLTRFNAKYSSILETTVTGFDSGDYQHVFAACLKSPSGEYTLYVVNDGQHDVEAELRLENMDAAKLYRYRITQAEHEGKNDLRLNPEQGFEGKNDRFGFSDLIPAKSISVYSSYFLNHDESGIFH
jgi:hypothetical protein